MEAMKRGLWENFARVKGNENSISGIARRVDALLDKYAEEHPELRLDERSIEVPLGIAEVTPELEEAWVPMLRRIRPQVIQAYELSELTRCSMAEAARQFDIPVWPVYEYKRCLALEVKG